MASASECLNGDVRDYLKSGAGRPLTLAVETLARAVALVEPAPPASDDVEADAERLKQYSARVDMHVQTLLLRTFYVLFCESRGALGTAKPLSDVVLDLPPEIRSPGDGTDPVDVGMRVLMCFRRLRESGADSLFEEMACEKAMYDVLRRDSGDARQQKVGEAWTDMLRHIATKIDGGKRVRLAFNSLLPRDLGTIYEQMMTQRLQATPGTAAGVSLTWQIHKDSSIRLKKGAFYTNDWAVQRVVRKTLEPLVHDVTADKSPGQAIAGILSLRVLDPAAGTGHFLLGALNYLTDALQAQRQRKEASLRWR